MNVLHVIVCRFFGLLNNKPKNDSRSHNFLPILKILIKVISDNVKFLELLIFKFQQNNIMLKFKWKIVLSKI